MRTVRRLLYRDIVASVGFVALAFLALFFFIDFVDRMDDIGVRGRGALDAVLAAAWLIPGHLYELMPIAVLIGTIYSLSRMAQACEFTILRTGGLGPGRALGLLAVLGAAFAVFTLLVGDYATPLAERQELLLRARLTGGVPTEGAGAWLKERRSTPDGEHGFSINIAGIGAGGLLQHVRIFEFDDDDRLVAQIEARSAAVDPQRVWHLADAEITQHHSLVQVAARVPDCVINLLSALTFHELTDELPAAVWIAVRRGHRAPKLDTPRLELTWTAPRFLALGVTRHRLEGVEVAITDPARTVADCFRYRSRVGVDVAIAALRDYDARYRGGRDALWAMAGACRVQTVLRPYLEALS